MDNTLENFFAILDEILEKYGVSEDEIEALYSTLDDTEYSVEAESEAETDEVVDGEEADIEE